ncbi:hypothetical protein D3C84_1270840 [compost metagenome]
MLAVAGLSGEGESAAHADDLMGGQSTGAQSLLMAAAMHLCTHVRACPGSDVECADTFGPIDLVCRE